MRDPALDAAVVVIGLLVVLSGFYNVAATRPHLAPVEWALSATMDRSVEHHAAGIPVSNTYNSPDMKEGYEHFDEMCVVCHGAPGIEQSEIGKGLYPLPPDLTKTAGDWAPSELFWIAKYGIRDTGMSAEQYQNLRKTPSGEKK